MSDKKTAYYYGIGRRKEATARVRLVTGQGQVLVNGKIGKEYFTHPRLVERILEPLTVLSKQSAYDISIKVDGGGKSGQADASRLAAAKALTVINPEWRTTLKKAGFIKGDSRVKERKKYGLKRARKAPQFTKR